jgi:mono/diheme cytochrome c family protein
VELSGAGGVFCLFDYNLAAIAALIVVPDIEWDREQKMKPLKGIGWIAVALAACLYSGAAYAGEDKPEFTKTFLNDEATFNKGKEIWFEQCTHCHGAKAYPGKAPQLNPRRYKPSFVYRRITKGFRKMPPWNEVYDKDERMAVVVYIMSNKFSP